LYCVRPAIARALKDHLVFDLLHLEQLFDMNEDAKRFNQPDQFCFPAFCRQGFHGQTLRQVLDIADEEILFVGDTSSGKQSHGR
jgi:hypothetical protein